MPWVIELRPPSQYFIVAIVATVYSSVGPLIGVLPVGLLKFQSVRPLVPWSIGPSVSMSASVSVVHLLVLKMFSWLFNLLEC